MFKNNNNNKQTSSTNNKKCVNPVFEKWIQEWRDDAIARDLQSKHTFTKCLISLRKYPMPLYSGKDCNLLEGFGDKICKAIDEKLKKFLDNGGILHEIDLVNCSDEDENVIVATTSKKTSQTSRNNVPMSVDDDKSDSDSDLISVEKEYASRVLTEKSTNSIIKIGSKAKTSRNNENNDGDDLSENKTSKKSKTTGPTAKKTYIPEYRSGPYALLVALFNNETDGNDDYMLKKDLIKEAQQFCNSSFTSTDPNSHYSAWNSMSLLIKKNLVIKENKLPARYKLTEEGRNLATTILYGAKENTNEDRTENQIEKSNELGKKANENNYYHTGDNQEDELDEFYANEIITEPIKIHQIEPVQTETLKLSKDNAAKKSSDVIELSTDSDNDNENDIIAIEEEPKTSKLTTNEQPKRKPLILKKNNFNHSESDSDSLPDIDIGSKFSYENKSPVKSTSSTATQPTSKSSVQRLTDRPLSSTGLTQPMRNITTQESSKITSKFSEQAFLKKTPQNSLTPSVLYSFPAGSFDILLFVDNCEQSHAKRQDLLIDELKKSKIKFDVGKLNVGDFTWIARRKNGNNNDDIILDFIVERKRMDDFCQSIIDGRYKEQKFRIKKSGITKIVYLIEEFGSMKHMSLPEKSNLLQADVNTQLIDHLIVHHTNDPKDSAYYLIEMTNYITKCFKNLTLNACAKEQIDEFNKTKNSFESTYFMKFDEFNKFSNKNKPLTIREMFAKCLMKIQGVSQEKCLAIIDIYPTPHALMKEYSKLADDSKREKLLANIKYGTQSRNIGPAISKLVAQLFYTNGPLN